MELIKSFDLYANNINMYFKGEKNLKTTYGGILSIITLTISIGISFIFGRDFYFRTNSKVSKETVITRESTILPISELQLAWRLENSELSNINFDNILFPEMIHSIMQRKTNDTEYQLIESNKINITTCDKVKIYKEFSDYYNLSQWFCFDFEKLENSTFSGDYTSDTISSFSFSFNSSFLSTSSESRSLTSSL